MTALLSHPLWTQLGLTLAHFLWQGAAVAVLLAGVLVVLRRRSPQARYLAGLLALAAMLACPVGTLWYVHVQREDLGDKPRGSLEAPVLVESGTHSISDFDFAAADPISTGGGSPVDAVVKPTAGGGGPRIGEDGAPAFFTFSLSHLRWWRDPALRERALHSALAAAAALWAFCVLILALRLMSGWLALRRWRRGSQTALPAEVNALVERLAERLRLTSSLDVRASESVRHPLAFGLLRPIVLLPIATIAQCPTDLLEAMIAHELAHIRRHDLWVNVLQRVIETLLFYHPAVWWISGRVRLERELCCDDLAVAATGRRIQYAEALVALARQAQPAAALALSAGMFGGRTTLSRRVRRILQLPHALERTRAWLAGPVALLLVTAVVLVIALPPRLTRGSPSTQPAEQPAAIAINDATAKLPAAAVGSAAPEEQLTIIQTQLPAAASEPAAPRSPEEDLLGRARLAVKAFQQFMAAVFEEQNAQPGQWSTDKTGLMEQQVRHDLRILKLDGYKNPYAGPWCIEDVVLPEDGAWTTAPALLFGRTFDARIGAASRPSRVVAWMTYRPTDQSGRWGFSYGVSKLAVLPAEDAQQATEQLYHSLLIWPDAPQPAGARTPRRDPSGTSGETFPQPSREVTVDELRFQNGRPRDYRLIHIKRATDASGVVKVAGEFISFSNSLRNIQLFRQDPDSAATQPLSSANISLYGDTVAEPAGRPATPEGVWSPNRPITPGDRLDIRALDFLINGQWTDLSQVVDENGEIYLPTVGKVKAAGLTPSKLRDLIIEMGKKGGIYREDMIPAMFIEYAPAGAAESGSPRAGVIRGGAGAAMMGGGEFAGPAAAGVPGAETGAAPRRYGPGTRVPPADVVVLAAPPADLPETRVPPPALYPVRSLADGMIAEVKVRPGQHVKKGDLLVRLEGDDLRTELAAAEVRLESALDESRQVQALRETKAVPESDLRKAEYAFRLAQLEVQRWKERLARTSITSPADGTVFPPVEGPGQPGVSAVGKSLQYGPAAMLGQKVTAGEAILTVWGDTPASRPAR